MPRLTMDSVEEDGSILLWVMSDKNVEDGAIVWLTPSLQRFIEVVEPADLFRMAGGQRMAVELKLLMTPEEAGQTIGGAIHIRERGTRSLAQPLPVSLQRAADQSPDEDGENGNNGGNDENGENGSVGNLLTWSVEELTKEHFVDGAAEIELTANRDLRDVMIWLTPSLQRFFTVEPDKFDALTGGEPETLKVSLLRPEEEVASNIGGTIHVRSASFLGFRPRTWPEPLPVNYIVNGDEEEEEDPILGAAVDSASFESRPLAPGQIISLFVEGLPPGLRIAAERNPGTGLLPIELEGVMVLFNGIPAPLLGLFDTQVNAVVPRGISGSEVEIKVVNKNKVSTPLPAPLRSFSPGLFTLEGGGRGQAAAINHSGGVNSPQNPVRRGQTMMLFGTGAGEMDPPLADGEAALDASHRLAHPVRILVGGVDAEVLYSGAAPGMSGVVQWNIRIPAGIGPGPHAVEIIVGGVSSGTGVTISVQ